MVTAAKKCRVENKTAPNFDRLPEADISDMETYLDEIQLILPVVGINLFRKPLGKNKEKPQQKRTTFTTRNPNKGIDARACEIDGVFVLLKGSLGSLNERVSFKGGIKVARDRAMTSQVIEPYGNQQFRVLEDIEFSSPSAAAVFLYGTSRNGRTDWKLYGENIEGDDITAYLWTFDKTWDHTLSGTGDYKYMVRLETSIYNEATLVNERTFFVSGIAASDVPTQNTVDYAGDMRGEYSDAGSEVGKFDEKIFLTLDFSKDTVDGKIPIGDFDSDTNPYLKINTANVKNNQFTTTVELADCTDPSCPTITASQLTGGLYGPGAAESAGTFVSKGISFGGDDYDDNDPRDFTVTAACGAKKNNKASHNMITYSDFE